jgi:hypothetical protein
MSGRNRRTVSAVAITLAGLGVAATRPAPSRALKHPPHQSQPPLPCPPPRGDWPGVPRGGRAAGRGQADRRQAARAPLDVQAGGGAGPIEGSAAIVGPHVYVGDTKGRLLCLNLSDGKPKWTYKVEAGFAATPLVMAGGCTSATRRACSTACRPPTGTRALDVRRPANGQPIAARRNAAGDKGDLRATTGPT